MSRIYFHSLHGEAEVFGTEHAHLGLVVNDVAASFLSDFPSNARARYSQVLPHDHYLQKESAPEDHRWQQWFHTAFATAHHRERWNVNGARITPLVLKLNTLVALQSPVLTFIARVYGTCEIHGYVEGSHRTWLAGIITQGRETGLLREPKWAGWENVVELLRERDDEPVVLSYSVTDGFPTIGPGYSEGEDKWLHGSKAGQRDEERREEWWEQTDEARWEWSMRHLREWGEGDVDLCPDTFMTRYFGDGDPITVWDMENWLDDATR